jgi:DnaJ-class molecular chaperone
MAKPKIKIECPNCHGSKVIDIWEGGIIVRQDTCPKCEGDGEIVFGRIVGLTEEE